MTLVLACDRARGSVQRGSAWHAGRAPCDRIETWKCESAWHFWLFSILLKRGFSVRTISWPRSSVLSTTCGDTAATRLPELCKGCGGGETLPGFPGPHRDTRSSSRCPRSADCRPRLERRARRGRKAELGSRTSPRTPLSSQTGPRGSARSGRSRPTDGRGSMPGPALHPHDDGHARLSRCRVVVEDGQYAEGNSLAQHSQFHGVHGVRMCCTWRRCSATVRGVRQSSWRHSGHDLTASVDELAIMSFSCAAKTGKTMTLPTSGRVIHTPPDLATPISCRSTAASRRWMASLLFRSACDPGVIPDTCGGLERQLIHAAWWWTCGLQRRQSSSRLHGLDGGHGSRRPCPHGLARRQEVHVDGRRRCALGHLHPVDAVRDGHEEQPGVQLGADFASDSLGYVAIPLRPGEGRACTGWRQPPRPRPRPSTQAAPRRDAPRTGHGCC